MDEWTTLTLDFLSPWALYLILAEPQLTLKDLAAVQCVCSSLCEAARNPELPQWRRVRVVGAPPYLQNKLTFKARAFR